jgi:membrane protein YdbS with pleckstrin-like domain
VTGRPAGEEVFTDVTWLRPSPRLLAVRRTEIMLVALPSLVLGLVIPLVTGAAWVALLVGGIVVALAVLADLLVRRRIRSWRYAEREDDLVLRRGLLFDRLTIVPYGRMQFVDVVAGPLERIFGVASVHLHTAAAATDARIPGLGREDAAQLRDALTRLGETRAAGL